MGNFSAIFVKEDGLDEELGAVRQLRAESLGVSEIHGRVEWQLRAATNILLRA